MYKFIMFFIILLIILSCNDKFDLSSPYTVDKNFTKDKNSCFTDSDCDKMKGEDYNCNINEPNGNKCICDTELRVCQYACNYRNCPSDSECDNKTGECICPTGYIYEENSNSCKENYAYGKYDFSLGKNHTSIIRSGELFVWGSNDTGKLGIGEDSNDLTKNTPVRLGNDKNWLAVANSMDFSCALKLEKLWRQDTYLYCWGRGKRKPFKVNTEKKDWKFITANKDSVFILDSKGVLYEVNGDSIEVLQEISFEDGFKNADWKFVSMGINHFCGIKTNDKLYCWGEEEFGQVGNGSNENFIKTPVQIGEDDWILVSCGFNHTCGIKENNKLYCWGKNEQGELGIGDDNNIKNIPVKVGEDDWSIVSCGYDYTCGIKNSELYCWGKKDKSQFGDAKNESDYENFCNMGETEPYYCFSPIKINTDIVEVDIKDIKLGLYKDLPYNCLLDSNKKLYCRGYNTYGELGESCGEITCNSFEWVKLH